MRIQVVRKWWVVAVLIGCSSETAPPAGQPLAGQPAAVPVQPGVTAMPPATPAEAGAAAAPPATTPLDGRRPSLCERNVNDDAVRDAFCGAQPPAIQSLRDLQVLLDVIPPERGLTTETDSIAALGHSTALAGHLISPLNPRVILIGAGTVFTFQRGVQRIEIVSEDRRDGSFNFYLLSFEQACNAAPSGCSKGHLYTPQLETGWTRVGIEDDEDLKNTRFDCRQCHQRARETPKLLMRELESPWTHFFFPAEFENTLPGVSGSDLMRDYLAAKGDELYGGAPVEGVSSLSPFSLQVLVGNDQPLLFDAPTIETERWPSGPNGFATEVQPSPTWENAYEAFKRGEQLALPYLEQRATDPAKQAALTQAYQRYRKGEITADELPDLGDIFPDDPMLRARIGLQTEPGATPVAALIQACGSCHNDVLDQSLTRARFNIDLSRLTRADLDLAIQRIELPPTSPSVMPPSEARQLDAETKQRLIAFLRDDTARQPDPVLQRAAQLGMSGGGVMGSDSGGFVTPTF